VDLMRTATDPDAGTVRRRLGDRNCQADYRGILVARRGTDRRADGRTRKSKLSCGYDEMIAHSLELSDRAAKLLSLSSVNDAEIDRAIHRANHLDGSRQRAA
jgi:hypothetical protein